VSTLRALFDGAALALLAWLLIEILRERRDTRRRQQRQDMAERQRHQALPPVPPQAWTKGQPQNWRNN